MKLIESKKTTRGNKIKSFIYEPINDKFKTIFLIGRIHGNEPEGEYIVNQIKEKVDNGEISLKNRLIFIPCFNPDGKELNIRGNGRAVDLNRNYDTKTKPWNREFARANRFSGDFAESEIETKFMINLSKKYKPDLVITIHSPLKNVNYDGDERAEKIAKKIADYVKYPLVETIEGQKGYGGSMGTYFGYDKNIPIITIETESCAINNYLSDFKKAIIVNNGKILDRELESILGDIKQILDWENLNLLFHKKDLRVVEEETDKKIKECFVGYDVILDFDKIREAFIKNGGLDNQKADKNLKKFTEALTEIIKEQYV